MLDRNKTALVLIDIQEKLFRLMPEQGTLVQHMRQLIQGTQVLKLPIVWAEQYPEGMGSTIPEVADLLEGLTPTPKRSFSVVGHEPLRRQIHDLHRRQFLLAGIEAHVCVYQTAVDLLEMGFEVEVVADATASRTAENRQIGLERVRRAGAALTSVETVLFELLRAAEGPRFKEILAIVK